MIITRLTLNNFRVFRGTQEIDLAPRSKEIGITRQIKQQRPIVLFGGLNGAGKTSILIAIRLALHGRQALGRNLSGPDYINQLGELIHKASVPGSQSDRASIELEFVYNQQGSSHTYKIIRSWKKGHKDKLALDKDGEALSELNYEQCQGFLNELIPTGIADLFFFDGEKIAELAEDESGEVLQTAVRRLLGLDVIGKLKSDLAIFLKRKGVEGAAQSVHAELKALEQNCQAHKDRAAKLRDIADQLKVQIVAIQTDIQAKEAQLSSQGGAWASSREAEQSKADFLIKEKAELEKQIRLEMEGALPIALAPKAVASLLAKLELEQKQKQKQHFSDELAGFLEVLKGQLSFALSSSAPVAMAAIKDCFADYQKQLPNEAVLFDISEREYRALEAQANIEAKTSFARFASARKRLSALEEELAQTAANIARAPAQEQVQGLFGQVRELDKQKQKLVTEYHRVLEEAKRALREAQDLTRKTQKLHEKHAAQTNAAEGVENAQNTLMLLDAFAKELTAMRVTQLEREFISSYQRLARKEDLHYRASINPVSFDVELIDDNGHIINRKAMSAGEKQIYAISILEALGKTSGRSLPVIIDTPLGRLDSKHRDKLVEHYFPEASHQVVILSTDTEIDESYVESLKDDISHRFEICFDSATKSSRVVEGYFWGQQTKEAI
ncbi:DNA sulfur modification protein DndD [Shewanella algae]|uniref:DNA sulfur modification protein DndD n=1 Tax=Shewanella algae TaxID=38313 RepID=UPI0031F4F0E0